MLGVRARKSPRTLRKRSSAQRHRALWAGGGGLVVAVASALSIASFSGVDVAGAAVAKAQSIADLMRQRSPGERTQAHLTKTKRMHAVLAERALPEIPALAVYTPPVQLLAPPFQPTLAALPELPVLAAAFAPPPLPFAPRPGGIFAPVPGAGGCCGGGGGGPGGGGPGGGGSPPGQPTPPTPQQPPAVPEPGTWALMIVGFGLSGLIQRRRRSKVRLPFNA